MLTNLKIILAILFIIPSLNTSCNRQIQQEEQTSTSLTETEEIKEIDTVREDPYEPNKEIQVGAARILEYISLLEDKTIALLVNQTSVVDGQHLADLLQSKGINIKTIFAPEHGFRGKADAGEQVKDGKDVKTGIPLVSLYGKKKKPASSDLAGIDLVVFDIQDVGARFYTYISSMHYMMEACAENDVEFLVLDRPNPNGHFVDGPILKPSHTSFVGMHEVPVVHGMTVGEYARMINEEGWLKGGVKCALNIVPCNNYTHQRFYALPIKPSPNLPNMHSIYLYPSLCLFEGTNVSIGRGTNKQFQVIGHPAYTKGSFTFTPKSMEGAKYPKHENKTCNGYDLSGLALDDLQADASFNLNYVIDFYKNYPDKENFFLENKFFDKLAGSDKLRKQIIAGKSADEIRATWQGGLDAFKYIRKKYLIYE